MKRIFGLALGILTAIGGFVDIGDLVTNAVVGSRFGLSLAWIVVVGVLGICIFAQMSGRVAAVSGRATFELIRERLGPRLAVMNLGASFLINLMTLTAEIGGVALALQLVSSVDYLLWVPFAAIAIWLVIWRVKFKIMENVAGLVGLCLIGFAVGLFLTRPGLERARPPGCARRIYGYGEGNDVLVLRRRTVRRRHDPVRGFLLLLGCR
jgi:manganese transport protein